METKCWEDMSQFFLGSKDFAQKRYLLDKEFILEESSGTKIYHQLLRTSTPEQKASIVFIHGATQHSTCYMEAAQSFADQGFFVHLYDYKGHGYSSGERYGCTLEDLQHNFLTVLTKVRQDLPLFIFTHSMGGGMMVCLLSQNPNLKLAGIIFHNPFVFLTHERPMSYKWDDWCDV